MSAKKTTKQTEPTPGPIKKKTTAKKPAAKVADKKRVRGKTRNAIGGKSPEGEKNRLDSGTPVDVDTMEWTDGCKLTLKQKKWVFWYTCPDNEGFQNALASAILAGYAKGSASVTAHNLKNRPDILREVSAIMKKLRVKRLADEYERIIDKKISRANFNIKDFYKTITKIDKDTKQEYEVEILKNLEELAPELQELIDGVDYRSNKGIRVYTLPNRDKAMDDVIKLYKDSIGKGDVDDYDVEAVAEIVKEKISVTMTVRRKNEKLTEDAGIFDIPKGLPEEE